MSTTETAGQDPLTKLTGNAPTATKPKDFPAMLTAWLPEIRRALPKHLNADRMSRIALTAFRRTPKLGFCDPRSVFAAVIQAAQLGLEPDTLGRSYLIPYGKECQFVPGWKGLVDLMNRSGQGSVYTGAIFKDQRYDYIDGSERKLIIHNETALVDPLDITHVFAVGHIKNGMFPVIELWRMEKVLKHRDRYNKVGTKHYSYGNLEMYARKVVLLQVLKYMPCSPELAMAMSLNDAAEMGPQRLNLDDAIEGTWTQVENEPETSKDTGPKEPTRTGAGEGHRADGDHQMLPTEHAAQQESTQKEKANAEDPAAAASQPTGATGKPPESLTDKADDQVRGPAAPKARGRRGSPNFGDE